ncbi:glycosyltransferase family 2 protein [Kiritimatiellaeota bacterium B1221]|nr:glycosyltransferase family 2 protein [Kiritimatiellaeota bacterium B1221]
MKVSVLLPFYNAESTLADAVESVRAQSFEDWELLLLDDGSTDGGGKLADGYSVSDSRIQCLTLTHGGIVSALNAGLKRAEGDFIARMDADDISLQERLLKQIQFLDEYKEVDVLATQVIYGGDAVKQAGYAAYVDWQNKLFSHEDHFQKRFVDAPLAHPTVMFRREMVQKFGGYREGNFPEDFELWLRWMQGGATFAKLPEPLYQWNDLSTRLSRCDSRYDPKAFYEIKCDYIKKCVPEGRPLWLWGAGRNTRQRFSALEPFAGYVDVDVCKIGQAIQGRPVIAPDELPKDAFILSGVANRGIGEKIDSFLQTTGRKAVRDFLLCA